MDSANGLEFEKGETFVRFVLAFSRTDALFELVSGRLHVLVLSRPRKRAMGYLLSLRLAFHFLFSALNARFRPEQLPDCHR
jgi:hypothetical protein